MVEAQQRENRIVVAALAAMRGSSSAAYPLRGEA